MTKPTRILFLAALASCASLGSAHAQNTVSVLQFGTVNVSSTTQSGATSNTATTLQFGSVNWAGSTQSGPVLAPTVNNATIGQSGTISNFAAVGQLGWSNTSTIGQLGALNTGAIMQTGVSNGSLVIQQVSP
ncbi:MAG TPA: curlin [Pseudolabrys sp.]|nr:curlin [Pseudolabrys sp.]